jgi:hypothetical protein
MATRNALLIMALVSASPALAQEAAEPALHLRSVEPQLDLGRGNLSLPLIDYQAPDGTRKRGKGIIIGRDIAPNASVGIGVFKMKPKYEDPAGSNLPSAGKSTKVSLGFSLRF